MTTQQTHCLFVSGANSLKIDLGIF